MDKVEPRTGVPEAPPRPPPRLQWASQPELLKLLHLHVPVDESPLGDYACAWNRDVLIQGRMYLTQHHIAFKGWSNVVR